MSSEQRSSSAVRNLRSIFENKQSADASPVPRGRSSNELGSDKENGAGQLRPTSKVRASFFSVDLAPGMASATDASNESGNGSLGVAKDTADAALEEVKKVAAAAKDKLVDAAVETPLASLGQAVKKEDRQAENPDKPVTGAEEEPSSMNPADPASESAVSGGKALSSATEDLRQGGAGEKDTQGSKKPKNITTKAPTKPASASVKSPTALSSTSSKGELNAAAPKSHPVKKGSRSSLTAPTAASMARSGAATDKAKSSPSAKPKPREATKPANVSSHLTAPTAAFRAKHEPEKEPVASSGSASSSRASLGGRPKPTTTSTKPHPRPSLAGAQRTDSNTSASSATRKQAPPPDDSFLDRMTKPTAASQNRGHDKPEPKSPVQSKPTSSKSSTNGKLPIKPNSTHAENEAVPPEVEAEAEAKEPVPAPEPSPAEIVSGKVAAEAAQPLMEALPTQTKPAAAAVVVKEAAAGNPAPVEKAKAVPSTEDITNAVSVEEKSETAAPEPTGAETPLAHVNGDGAPALEATPAGLGGDETIR